MALLPIHCGEHGTRLSQLVTSPGSSWAAPRPNWCPRPISNLSMSPACSVWKCGGLCWYKYSFTLSDETTGHSKAAALGDSETGTMVFQEALGE